MRRPKAAALKKLAGTPGHPRLPNEPKLPAGVPPMPPDLDGGERQAWTELAGALTRLRVLTESDGAILELAATELALYRHASREVRERGPVLKASRTGSDYASAWLGVRGTCGKRLASLLSTLGLSPTDRARLVAIPDPDAGAFKGF